MTVRRMVGVTGLFLATLLVPASPAHAGVTTDYTAGVLTVTSDGGSDVMVFTCQSSTIRLNGAVIPGVGSGCGIDIVVDGNGGNDVIDTTAIRDAADSVDLDGGDGDDVIAGGEAVNPANSDVVATGGPGNDTMRFTSGDTITGGEGDDVFEVTNGFHSAGATLQGQGGTDTYRVNLSGLPAVAFELLPLTGGLVLSLGGAVAVAPWSSIDVVDLTLTDGAETVRGQAFPGRVLADGRGGNDTLLGGDQGDVLKGGPGNDTLEGNSAADSLDGGDGDDVLRSRDTYADTLACGGGADIAVLDATDTTSSCETRDTGSSSDATKPKPTFSGAKVSGGKLKLTAKCPTDELRCVGDAALRVKGKRNGGKVSVKLGDVLVVADGGRKDKITLALTPAQLSALKGVTGAKLTIAYNVVDAGGNVGKGTKTIKLKL